VQLGLPFGDEAHSPAPVAPRRLRVESSPLTALEPVYFVRNRRARRYVLRVDADGRVRVTIPRGGSKRDGSTFALAQRGWIARQRAKQTSRPLAALDVVAARTQAAGELPARLLELAGGLGLSVSRVSVRNQRSRWGSCGPDGHISLNWRLVLMPDWVRDYVLIHELMHLRRLDHSPAYWKLVEAACPRYRLARRWLRLNGPSLR
jgi:predicted metal-dependent hydrolase